MILLANKEIKSYEKQKVCHMCENEFCYDKNKKSEYALYHKVKDHCHYTRKFRGDAHSECNLRYKWPTEISVVFHNGSTYDYHFIIKQLAEELEGEYKCLGQNIEKYITFSVPHNKENGKIIITYRLKFIDSSRFMWTSLSNLVDNLPEIYDKECRKWMERKKIRLNYEYIGFKNGRFNHECEECKK